MKSTKRKIKLNLGCGGIMKAGYINVDNFITLDEILKQVKAKKGLYSNASIGKGARFVQADIRKLPFPNNYADYVELTHTIEHLKGRDIIPCLKEIRRVMKKGAKFVVSTNDMDGIALEWLDEAMHKPFNIEKYLYITEEIYGTQLTDGEFHLTPFNADFLNWCLGQAGFKKGQVGKIRKGSRFPKLEELEYDKKAVARNDQIFAIVMK